MTADSDEALTWSQATTEGSSGHRSGKAFFPQHFQRFNAMHCFLFPAGDASAKVPPAPTLSKAEETMRYQKRGRSGTKLQMKCHKCRSECAPKDGDWHDSKEGQVFLCRTCGPNVPLGSTRPKLHYTSIFATPARA